jgi:ADP-ribose pyrophosphatase YjhB (NUDIX family)
MTRNAYCNACGTKYAQTDTYPRTCAACGLQVWSNPIPVAVALVPVIDEARPAHEQARFADLLVVRRAIPPGVGKLALVGGFVEDHETWQVGLARELREEANVIVDPAKVSMLWVTSTEPAPNRILMFATTEPIARTALPALQPNSEVQERGVVDGPDGLADSFAFPLHVEAAQRYFRSHGRGYGGRFTPC